MAPWTQNDMRVATDSDTGKSIRIEILRGTSTGGDGEAFIGNDNRWYYRRTRSARNYNLPDPD